jgi:hypothetical protein
MSRIGCFSASRLRSRRGLASALIIMLLVLLVFFGVLSLVTTAADLRLSQKRADWSKGYYQADAAAVRLVAELDQYCLGLDETSLQAGSLASLLDIWLDGAANVQEYQVISGATTAPLSITALVAEQAGQGQGIELRLRILTGPAAPNTERIVIESWIQWQPAFDYEGTEGGIWKG